ncbi:hypothetical protein D3C72_319540 [compost metagenome]
MAKQGGFSLIETVTAVAVLGGALALATVAYAASKQTTIYTRQQEAAWLAILSQENALRGLSYASLQPRDISIGIPELPGGHGTVSWKHIPGLNAFEAKFEVTWQGPKRRHRLTHAAVLSPYAHHAETKTP